VREWARASVDTVCGGPHATFTLIRKGDPVLVLKGPGYGREAAGFRKVRCVKCAGPAPADLPPLEEHTVTIRPMLHLRSGAGALPFDYKAAQAGEREPGEDG